MNTEKAKQYLKEKQYFDDDEFFETANISWATIALLMEGFKQAGIYSNVVRPASASGSDGEPLPAEGSGEANTCAGECTCKTVTEIWDCQKRCAIIETRFLNLK